MPLVYKIVNSWIGKTSFDRDDLISYGMRGLTWAMNFYGKKRDALIKKEQETGEEIDTTTSDGEETTDTSAETIEE